MSPLVTPFHPFFYLKKEEEYIFIPLLEFIYIYTHTYIYIYIILLLYNLYFIKIWIKLIPKKAVKLLNKIKMGKINIHQIPRRGIDENRISS